MAAKKAQRICNPQEAPLASSLQIMLSTSQAEQLSMNKEICACTYHYGMSLKRELMLTKWPDNIVFVNQKKVHEVRQQSLSTCLEISSIFARTNGERKGKLSLGYQLICRFLWLKDWPEQHGRLL